MFSFISLLAPAGADGPYDNGVVAADASLCSEVGRDILKKKGSAVDSAIATSFCIGVINMHSAGIGGGGFMTVYNKSTNTAEVFDYREKAPGKANSTMYVNSSLSSKIGKVYVQYSAAFNTFIRNFKEAILPLFRIERFSIKCRKTQTKVITLASHSRRGQSNEPIRACSSKYM